MEILDHNSDPVSILITRVYFFRRFPLPFPHHRFCLRLVHRNSRIQPVLMNISVLTALFGGGRFTQSDVLSDLSSYLSRSESTHVTDARKFSGTTPNCQNNKNDSNLLSVNIFVVVGKSRYLGFCIIRRRWLSLSRRHLHNYRHLRLQKS
jgi:hypothetical protein